jgi:hypothetical protein
MSPGRNVGGDRTDRLSMTNTSSLGRRLVETDAENGIGRISTMLNGVSMRDISRLVSRFQRIMVPSREEDTSCGRGQTVWKKGNEYFVRIESVVRRVK